MRHRMSGVLLAAALCAAPAAAQTRQGMVSLPEGRLFYEVVGNGEPIVVVHGGPGMDHAYLRPGLDVLASSHALVYYDQRGTGRSGVALSAETINLDAFVRDIDELRSALGYERITLLGHSFGGLIAMAYAREHPETTRGLILLSTAEPGRRFAAESAERAAAARTPEDSAEIAEAMADPGYAAGDAAAMSRLYRAAFRGTMRVRRRVNELDLDLAASTAKNGPEVARLLGGSMGGEEGVDWWDDLARIACPAVVLHGRYDIAPLEMARAVAEALPNGRFVALESGHFPYIEDPSGLTAAVAAFMTDLSR